MSRSFMGFHRPGRWHGKRSKVGTPYGRGRIGVLTRTHRIGIEYLPFLGYWIDSVWLRGMSSREPVGALVWVYVRPKMRRVKVSDRSSVKHLAALETELLCDHMPIVEFLGLLQYEDGEPRKPGFLMIWTDGPLWRCLMKDNDARAKLPVSASSLDELLDALAVLLSDEKAPWEPDDQADRMNARKRGK